MLAKLCVSYGFIDYQTKLTMTMLKKVVIVQPVQGEIQQSQCLVSLYFAPLTAAAWGPLGLKKLYKITLLQENTWKIEASESLTAAQKRPWNFRPRSFLLSSMRVLLINISLQSLMDHTTLIPQLLSEELLKCPTRASTPNHLLLTFLG